MMAVTASGSDLSGSAGGSSGEVIFFKLIFGILAGISMLSVPIRFFQAGGDNAVRPSARDA